MAEVFLTRGPCDPRQVTMMVTVDAEELVIRVVPFDCHDVYRVLDSRVEGDTVLEATAEYLHTTGSRLQIHAYRQRLERFGTGRAFRVKHR